MYQISFRRTLSCIQRTRNSISHKIPVKEISGYGLFKEEKKGTRTDLSPGYRILVASNICTIKINIYQPNKGLFHTHKNYRHGLHRG